MDLNILIVEDELIIYVHLEKTLKKLGFEHIHVAKNSKRALEIASQNKIDLLFSDIKIEGDMDGIDTAKILQNLYKLPVIFITAYKDQETLLRASEIDFLGYLLKPYRVDELEALLTLAISKYQLIPNNNTIKVGEYSYQKNQNILYKNEIEVQLSKKERLFTSLMFNSKNSIVPYSVIEEIIWQNDAVEDNARRTFIYRVKNKLPPLHVEKDVGIGIGLL